METTKFTQNEDAEMYPVAAKEGKICKRSPNFKILDKKRTLILLIGLSENKKIRRFIRKENVRKITFSEIASEIQEDDAIESWTEFQRNLNTEFSKRVQNALKKGTAVVEKNFKSLDCRLGFLEMAMEKNLAMETILIVSKVELKKDRELAKQLASRNLLKGIDKIYFL